MCRLKFERKFQLRRERAQIPHKHQVSLIPAGDVPICRHMAPNKLSYMRVGDYVVLETHWPIVEASDATSLN